MEGRGGGREGGRGEGREGGKLALSFSREEEEKN